MKQVPKKTAKTKKVIMLPEVMNFIQQPNRVTNAHYDYSLIQKKIFTAVMYFLQQSVKSRLEGTVYEQMELFRDSLKADKIQLKIPLRDLTSKQNYKDVRKSAELMAGIIMKLPGIDPFSGRKATVITNLMSVILPEYKYDRYIVVEMEKEVAKRLIEIDKDRNGIPVNYTRYAYEIIMRSKNKYTPRIYELISSWKKKGGFKIKLEDFREQLMLGDKYPTYKDLKNRVIIPAHKELYEKADCWFNCKEAGFEMRKDGKEYGSVIGLNFKVITPEFEQLNEVKRNAIVEMLRMHFAFKEEHFKGIEELLNDNDSLDKIQVKLVDINETIESKKHTEDRIISKANYTLKALVNFFKP